MKQKREGNTRLVHRDANSPGGVIAHVVSADSPPDVGSPHLWRTTLETSSCVIVYVVSPALLTG